DLLAQVAWRWPRRTAGREEAAGQVLAEAARLGMTGRHALTTYGRLLLEPHEPEDDDPLGVRHAGPVLGPLAAALDPLLPAPVDHFLVQADLTLVVPGPPEPALAAELELAADHESGGGASVYRVTEGSVRRALDAGYTTEELHELFTRRSRTPVPQTLSYLVDDVGRRHGGLRAGGAGGYLRSDDEALLAQVLADRRLEALALRRLAATVLVTPFPHARLVAALREAGYAPVPEDAAGAAVLAAPRGERAAGAAAPRRPVGAAAPTLTDARVAGIVEQLRRGEARASTRRRAPAALRAAQGLGADGPAPVQSHTDALAVLQQAVRDGTPVWVGYVDAHGAAVSRLVVPVSLAAGYLRAEDGRTETLHTFALHRITAAVPD
ncbi:MAG TPA: helicase-associated domain-containing protein, partial [Pilimelia sp.]|nr:helicase-associated domain-containing protein [Pilimelia sp.]